MKNAAGNIAIGAGILFALMGAGKGSAVLNIFGNKGQVGANVIVSGQRIGKMKRDGEARSHFSERILPGDHVVKLMGNGQELWSKEITAYESMEYFLDSSEVRNLRRLHMMRTNRRQPSKKILRPLLTLIQPRLYRR